MLHYSYWTLCYDSVLNIIRSHYEEIIRTLQTNQIDHLSEDDFSISSPLSQTQLQHNADEQALRNSHQYEISFIFICCLSCL
jgi:hypothetical protein